MAKSNKSMDIGSKRFFPPHGVVSLVSIEDREFAGTKEEFHVLELVRGGTLLVPTKAMASTTFRTLISIKQGKELMKRMRSKAKPKIDPSLEGKERASHFEELLKKGEASDYTEILRELMLRSVTDKITLNEQKLMETARIYFVDEVGSVAKMDANQFLAEVAKAAAPPPPPAKKDEPDGADADD